MITHTAKEGWVKWKPGARVFQKIEISSDGTQSWPVTVGFAPAFGGGIKQDGHVLYANGSCPLPAADKLYVYEDLVRAGAGWKELTGEDGIYTLEPKLTMTFPKPRHALRDKPLTGFEQAW